MRKLLIGTSVAALCAGFAMAAGAADNGSASAAGAQGMTQPGATSPGPATPRPADRDTTTSDAHGNTGQKQEGDPSGSARIGTAGGTDAGAAAAAAVQNGMTVVSADGNEVGTVSGVVRDADGRVTDLVLKTKGMLLGVGSSTVAVPIERAHVDGDEVTVTMTESEIEDLPEHRG